MLSGGRLPSPAGCGILTPTSTLLTRRRRSRLPLIALVLTAVVVAVAYFDRNSTSKADDRRVGYVDEVRAAVDRSNSLGREVDALRENLRELTRPVIARRLERLAGEAKAVVTTVENVDPPAALRGTHSLLLASMVVRADTLAALRPALDAALGSAPLDKAVDTLAPLGTDLQVSDRSYQLFVRGLGPPKDAIKLPDSIWFTDASWWQPESLRPLLAGLRAQTSLAPVHDLAVVTFTTDPSAAAMEGTNRVLPVTEGMRVVVVLANIGNEPEKDVTVIVTTTSSSGATDNVRRFVDLEAGQRVSLQLGLLHPVPNEASTLRIEVVPVDGESNVEDNVRTLGFIVRAT